MDIASSPEVPSGDQPQQSSAKWNPALTHPNNHRPVPRSMSRDLSAKKFPPRDRKGPGSPQLPRPAPNDRDCDFVLEEASPLSELERGVPDPVQIKSPKAAKERRRKTKDEEDLQLRVILNIYNTLPTPLEIFSQSQSNVHSIELKENESCFRLAGSLRPLPMESASESNILPVFISTPKLATVNMSARQEIKSFHFNPGPIGMIVELKGHRMICSKVTPKSQCSFHEQALVGSEIIAVNGKRVISLHAFVEEIKKSQDFQGKFVDITVSAFRGGRMKLDDMLSFTKKNKKMASLLGNMFTKGLDKDHSHGIELPAARESDSDSDEEDEGGEDELEDEEPNIFDDKPEEATSSCEPAVEMEPLKEEPEEDGSLNGSLDGSVIPERRGSAIVKGGVVDDGASLASSKKKFMQLYRADSDDEDSVHQLEGDIHRNSSIESATRNSFDREEAEQVSDGDEPGDIEASATDNQSTVQDNSGLIEVEVATQVVKSIVHVEVPIVVSVPVAAIDPEPHTTNGDGDENSSDEDEALVLSEEMTAKLKQQTIATALEEIATGEEVPIVLEEEKKEEESDEESEPGDVWDYATNLDGADYSPYRCLVCVPKLLEKSANGWGNPTCFLHFANFSTEWYLEVFWIDHESLLVPRVKLRNGERHNEMTSSDLVWCIIATYIEKKNRRKRIITDEDAESLGGDSGVVAPGKSNTLMLFRTASSVLTNVRSSFLCWIPWCSVAFSQRSRLTFNTEKMKKLDDEIDPPHLNIHIFDRHHKDL